MSYYLIQGMDWPHMMNDFLINGMNWPMAYVALLLVGCVALVAVVVVWQMLGGNHRPK